MNKETLEEAAEKYADFSNDYVPFSFGDKFNESTKRDFIAGAKWQAERMYSEEDLKLFARQYYREIRLNNSNLLWDDLADKYLEQFKKK